MKVKGASVAALADSIDGVRGTFLNDQAEELSNKKNTEILGILSDSYTTGGGKRRIVNTANKVRRIQEFETYGPKAFASIKDLDSDLKDRCIEITMVRAIKEYPYPDAYLTIWGDLRDKLYKNLLSKWQEVKVLYRDTGKDVSHRMKELWRPIETILRLENVSDEETRDIKGFFLESMQETQNELSENEIKLFETLKEILGEKDKEILTVTEIAEKFNKESKTIDEKEKRRIQIWIGRTINQLSLYIKHAGKKEGRKAYEFSYQHIENIQKRYETDETLGDYREIPGDSREIDHSSHNHNPNNELVDREIENEEIGVGASIPEREIEI